MGLLDEMSKDMSEAHIDALEGASNIKITDRNGFLEAFKGLVSCCSDGPDEDDSEDDEEPSKPSHKGIDIALVLGGKKKAG